jgi:hypothetical protein
MVALTKDGSRALERPDARAAAAQDELPAPSP